VPDSTVVDPSASTVERAAAPVLPSERLTRLAEQAVTELEQAGPSEAVGSQALLSERALADVLAAVDASTAANTKAAYRSDWGRFTAWTTERGFAALPAPALVVAHYVTEAAAEQTGVGKCRYAPATLTRWCRRSTSSTPPPAWRTRPGRVVRRALSGCGGSGPPLRSGGPRSC